MNINQTTFDSLSAMITAYMSPHPDLQTVLTEFVTKSDDADNDGA